MLKATMAALGMLALAGSAHAGGANMHAVQQQIQVAAKDGKVVVTLSVHNGGAKPVFVPKAVFEDDELFGRAFDVRDAATGAEIGYIGPMVKRGPTTKADFLAVKPGTKRSNSIDITRSYDFKPGTHTYTLAYAGNYLGKLAKLDAASPVTVAPVTFTYTAR
jgi:hypothetical protein